MPPSRKAVTVTKDEAVKELLRIIPALLERDVVVVSRETFEEIGGEIEEARSEIKRAVYHADNARDSAEQAMSSASEAQDYAESAYEKADSANDSLERAEALFNSLL